MLRWTLDDLARAPREALALDVRAAAEFAAGHLPDCGNVPVAEFRARRAELPPRAAALIVAAGSGPEAQAAARSLAALGFADLRWLDADVRDAANARDVSPAARLWRPAPFLAERLPAIPRGRALDLAAGTGRDSVHLATAGFTVEAWDRDAEALERARDLALRQGAAIATRVVDLEVGDPGIPPESFDLIVCFRYLHRPLFPAIAAALRPGGHLLYETFRVGQELVGRPRRPRFLLQSGELRRAFAGLEILIDEESDPPGGPVLARLHARRP